MTRDPSAVWRRRCLLFAALLFCLPASGCGLLLDEFTWLDRAPPPSFDPADLDAGP